MEIRKTTPDDLQRVMDIYNSAREFMKRSGNPTQWPPDYPSEKLILSDISNGNSYVVTVGNRIAGTFAFIIGEDPTYSRIEGCWLNNRPYGTIHRLASDGSTKGVADECLKFCKALADNIRIDTHKDNTVMLNWIKRSGFKECGVIYVYDGSPRIAFHYDSMNM
ncbi:MAG: GNAT family N-acetyltransferase [Muribaculaceae bacterium]|nr:GNAT family N-acetyltransferase [Muribaculaceae bacterium]